MRTVIPGKPPALIINLTTAKSLSITIPQDLLATAGDRIELAMSLPGPSVWWTGRALQAENDDLEKVGLALLYPAYDGALELLAIMDIRARSISFHDSATKARRATSKRLASA